MQTLLQVISPFKTAGPGGGVVNQSTGRKDATRAVADNPRVDGYRGAEIRAEGIGFPPPYGLRQQTDEM